MHSYEFTYKCTGEIVQLLKDGLGPIIHLKV
jgi:hypothetical protein